MKRTNMVAKYMYYLFGLLAGLPLGAALYSHSFHALVYTVVAIALLACIVAVCAKFSGEDT